MSAYLPAAYLPGKSPARTQCDVPGTMYPGVGELIEKPDGRRLLGKMTLTGGRSQCGAFQQ